jgi:tetratricopeptide (TPR) repeat protein
MLEPDEQTRPGAPADAVEAILQRTLEMARDGEWEEAAERLREALEDHPDSPYILCWLGVAEVELGLDGIAYERFKRALAQEPEDPVLLSTTGNALARFDDPEAEAALRTAAMVAPELPQARWMFGAYLVREGMLEKGLEELEAAVRLSPEDPVIHLERGVARALGGELEAATHAFGRASELAPDDGWPLILLGLTWFELDELDEAVRALDEGARLRPDDLEAQVITALVLTAVGSEDRALEMLERARLRAEGVDEALVLEVEERMNAGVEAALAFLRAGLAPSSFRERLIQRP